MTPGAVSNMTPEEEARWVADRQAGIPISNPATYIKAPATGQEGVLALLPGDWAMAPCAQEIAATLRITKSRVHQVLKVLLAEGLVERAQVSGTRVFIYRRNS